MSLHYKQINKVKNELDGQPSSFLACMHVYNYKATFSPMHLVFLELRIGLTWILKYLMKTTTKSFCGHSISNYQIKDEHIGQWNNKQNLSRFKPHGTTRTTIISLKKNWLKLRHICLMKLKSVKGLSKKMKRFNTIPGIVDTDLITSTVITEGVSIAAFASGVGLPVGIALSGTSLLLFLATVITRKAFKTFTVKQKNTIPLSCLPRVS